MSEFIPSSYTQMPQVTSGYLEVNYRILSNHNFFRFIICPYGFCPLDFVFSDHIQSCSFCRAFGQCVGWGIIFGLLLSYLSCHLTYHFKFTLFDKVSNGATFVNIDMVQNKKDGNRMLLIEGIQLYCTSLVLLLFMWLLEICLYKWECHRVRSRSPLLLAFQVSLFF